MDEDEEEASSLVDAIQLSCNDADFGANGSMQWKLFYAVEIFQGKCIEVSWQESMK